MSYLCFILQEEMPRADAVEHCASEPVWPNRLKHVSDRNMSLARRSKTEGTNLSASRTTFSRNVCTVVSLDLPSCKLPAHQSKYLQSRPSTTTLLEDPD